jgi:mono/diheme cytochrome c family protein
MTARKTYIVAALLAALTLLAVAQQTQKPAQAPDTVIKHVPVKPTSPASGEEMYVNYCAVCHGKDGRGTGPAVSALKVPPTDLTTLAEKNGGKYPSMHVSTVLRGEADVPAHGTKDMPVWGRCSGR